MENSLEKNSRKDFFKELLDLVLIAVVVVVPFRLFIAQPFLVDGLSMYPTFEDGDYLIVEEVSYRFNEPERGEVVVFRYPKSDKLPLMTKIIKTLKREPYEADRNLIKRVIGLPGEEVRIAGGTVTIVNEENPNGFTLDEPYVKLPKIDDYLTKTLGEGEYFVMGDNRMGSSDSRIWGTVPRDKLIGKPILRANPLSVSPGEFKDYKQEE